MNRPLLRRRNSCLVLQPSRDKLDNRESWSQARNQVIKLCTKLGSIVDTSSELMYWENHFSPSVSFAAIQLRSGHDMPLPLQAGGLAGIKIAPDPVDRECLEKASDIALFSRKVHILCAQLHKLAFLELRLPEVKLDPRGAIRSDSLIQDPLPGKSYIYKLKIELPFCGTAQDSNFWVSSAVNLSTLMLIPRWFLLTIEELSWMDSYNDHEIRGATRIYDLVRS